MYNPVVVRQWENYFADRTADTFSNPPENIDEHWVAIENAVFLGATQVVGQVRKGCQQIWLTLESQNGRKVLLTAASDSGRDTLELRYRVKSVEVQCSVRLDKREFLIEVTIDGNDFRTLYRITKEFAYGRKSFDDSVKEVKSRLLNQEEEELK